MRNLFAILSLIFLGSCSSKHKLQDRFEECLTAEQIEVILVFNQVHDEFVLSLYPSSENLNEAYGQFGNAVMDVGFDDYFLSDETLAELRGKLIDSGLNKVLYGDSIGLYNHESIYRNCFQGTEGARELSELLTIIEESGGSRYHNMTRMVIALQTFSESNDIDSMLKLLVTFEFVLGQFEKNHYTQHLP
jgi:hypothetical protein